MLKKNDWLQLYNVLDPIYCKVLEGSEKTPAVAANNQKGVVLFHKTIPIQNWGCEILFFPAREFQFDDVMIGSIMTSFSLFWCNVSPLINAGKKNSRGKFKFFRRLLHKKDLWPSDLSLESDKSFQFNDHFFE